MVDRYAKTFVSDVPAQVNDMRGGAQTDADILVEAMDYVGIWVYTSVNELVNDGPLTGSPTSTTLVTLAVCNRADENDIELSPSVLSYSMPNIEDRQVISLLEEATVTVNASHNSGAEKVVLIVSYSKPVDSNGVIFTANASFRVWFPTKVSIETSDQVLDLVLPHSSNNDVTTLQGCDNVRYQRSRLFANATFSAQRSDSTSSTIDDVTVDVTEMI